MQRIRRLGPPGGPAEAAARRKAGPPGPPAFVGRVYDGGALPTTSEVYYLVHPVQIHGPEVEGGAPTLSVDSSVSVPVFVVGSTPPEVDDDLICRFVNHRWVAERMTSRPPTVHLAGCPCDLPLSLTMTVTNPPGSLGYFHSCTLQYYDPVPPSFGFLSGSSQFLSTSTFTDSTQSGVFRYWFYCFRDYYVLRRIFHTSIYGSPYIDVVRYVWLIGFSNTCSPLALLLGRGLGHQGFDGLSTITITE